MYGTIIGLSMLKSANPYFRKHVLGTLDAHDFLFINAMLIFLFMSIYFAYLCCYERDMALKSFENYRKLTPYQHMSILCLTSITLVSAIYFIEFDKNYNTPLINSLFLKIASVVTMLFVGVILFEERYTYMQIVGFFMVIIGLFLILLRI